MSDLVKKLRSYPSATCKDKDIYEAADIIESQAKQVAELEEVNERQRVEINELRLVNSFEDVAWKAKDERIAELEAALKPFADASDVYLGSDDMSIAFRIIIGNLCQARKVLGEKE